MAPIAMIHNQRSRSVTASIVAVGFTFLVATTGLQVMAQEAGEFRVVKSMVQDQKAVFATVETADFVTARARIGGTVNQLVIDEGDKVATGKRIAVIIDRKLKLQVDAVLARIKSLESQQKLAKATYLRANTLLASGTIPQARFDEAENNLSVVTRNLDAMEAERNIIAQRQAEGAVIAPAGGRVLKVFVTEGAVVMPGEVIASIAGKGFVLRMQLPERHAASLSLGDVVSVGVGVSRGNKGPRKGVISQIYPELRRGRVIADVDVKGLGDFFIGERISVYVNTGERAAFVIPPKYLFRRYGLMFVRLKGGGDTVVQPGRSAGNGIEILSGVRDGDILVMPRVKLRSGDAK